MTRGRGVKWLFTGSISEADPENLDRGGASRLGGTFARRASIAKRSKQGPPPGVSAPVFSWLTRRAERALKNGLIIARCWVKQLIMSSMPWASEGGNDRRFASAPLTLTRLHRACLPPTSWSDPPFLRAADTPVCRQNRGFVQGKSCAVAQVGSKSKCSSRSRLYLPILCPTSPLTIINGPPLTGHPVH